MSKPPPRAHLKHALSLVDGLYRPGRITGAEARELYAAINNAVAEGERQSEEFGRVIGAIAAKAGLL